jgi:hypothetical protein
MTPLRHPASLLAAALCISLASLGTAAAQMSTGSITGLVTDTTGAALPGVTVSLAGERLIGGVQTQVTDATGAYRFDRLPPGVYRLRFELSGFRTLERSDIRVSAAFTATVNVQLELGAIEETITVAGESPTVDTKSNVQQVVMGQELLEGIPTGRDPWSLAKIIPGVHISTYDVGGTQSYQQSGMSVHGSLDSDKTFAIDGLAVNWPGGSGGATMMYYDQGMFEEVNYQTSAIPAEVAVGGIFLNMVTKSPGNRWRGDFKAYYANDDFQADNTGTPELRAARERFGFQGGNPITRAYDVNLAGGGAIIRDRLWVNGSYRKWAVDKLNLTVRNPDGSYALDDNTLVNYFGKLQWQPARDHRLSIQYNWTDKDRGHRVDPPPNFVDNRAALHQTNPSSSTQVKYTWVRSRLVFESNSSAMVGTTNYFYQDEVKPTDIRVEDIVRSTATIAAPRHEELPNYRLQFDNAVSYAATGAGGTHQLKTGVQYARLRMHDKFWVNGDMHILFADGVPNAVRIFNTPTSHLSLIGWWGVFVQDSWSLGSRLTLNLGARYDRAKGWFPEQTNPAGTFVGERRLPRTDVTDQSIAVWRTGLVYDPTGSGRTAIKASYSRYAQQVGLDRVQNVHPFSFTSGTVPWNDLNGDRVPQMNELDFSRFSGFPGVNRRYADRDGPEWPYSDEVTAGVEHELVRDVRVAVMYYHRTNRKRVGTRNVAVPPTAYTKQSVTVPGPPNGPGGTATFYNLDPAYLGRQDNVLDNDPLLDTEYDGVEFTVTKRFSRRWQLIAGLTIGQHEGGVAGGDLNDPNNAEVFPRGIVGFDSTWAFRLAGSYLLPGDFTLSGSLVSNQGFPYQSTYTVTRSVFPGLTRTSQSVALTRRGDERLPDVTMVDLRIARTFRLPGGRRITPQIDLFNIGNAATVVRLTSTVGSRYLAPAEILSPRVARVGVTVDF